MINNNISKNENTGQVRVELAHGGFKDSMIIFAFRQLVPFSMKFSVPVDERFNLGASQPIY